MLHSIAFPVVSEWCQVAYTIVCLGYPRWLGLAIDWATFDTILPSGERMRYPKS